MMNPNNEKALLEEALAIIEKQFETAGARAAEEFHDARRESLGLRRSYAFRGLYYRAEGIEIDGSPVIILYATDRPSFARIGAEDSIAAFRADYPQHKLEREVLFAMGLEPYPENYPDYE